MIMKKTLLEKLPKEWNKTLQGCGLTTNCSVLVGGSCVKDLDMIYIADKLDFKGLNKLKLKLENMTGTKVSISPMTALMWARQDLWSGKVARMVFKGVKTLFGNVWFEKRSITFEKVKEITKREASTELAYYLKMAVEKPEKREKATELIIQLITILI